MSVNQISGVNVQDAYNTYSQSSVKKNQQTGSSASATSSTDSTAASTADSSGVVYEKSSTSKTYTQNTELVAKMQADAEARTAQLKSLVEQMMSKQGETLGKADDMWSFLASGNYTVDEATKTQAQQDISEDGYWGVNQTSDRILDFAKALSGGDPNIMEQMRDAFKQGFEDATKTWGKDLPGISSDTYDAVMKKFDDFASQNSSSASTSSSADTTQAAADVTTN